MGLPGRHRGPRSPRRSAWRGGRRGSRSRRDHPSSTTSGRPARRRGFLHRGVPACRRLVVGEDAAEKRPMVSSMTASSASRRRPASKRRTPTNNSPTVTAVTRTMSSTEPSQASTRSSGRALSGSERTFVSKTIKPSPDTRSARLGTSRQRQSLSPELPGHSQPCLHKLTFRDRGAKNKPPCLGLHRALICPAELDAMSRRWTSSSRVPAR